MKPILVFGFILCGAIAVRANNDDEIDPTTEFVDITTENAVEEHTLSPTDFGSGARTVRNLGNLYKSLGLKTIWIRLCPGVRPTELNGAPVVPWFKDIARGRGFQNANREAFKRWNNLFLVPSGIMLVEKWQCLPSGGSASGSGLPTSRDSGAELTPEEWERALKKLGIKSFR